MARKGANKELTHYAADGWFNNYWSWLDNPDKTLTDNAGSHGWQGIELYNEMLRLDAHLSFLLRKRGGAVTSLEYQIEAGRVAGDSPSDKHMEQRDFIQGMFDELEESAGFATTRAAMFKAVGKGYTPAEIIYKQEGDKLVIDKIKTRNPARFRFNEQDQLIYVGSGLSERVVCGPWKFMTNTWGSDESPYGQGLLRELYPLWYFKSMGLKDFTRYLEKMGTAWVVASFAMGTQGEEIDNLMGILEEIQCNNVGAVPEGTDIDIKQAQHQGVKDIFSWIIKEYVDERMTLCLLEQTTSTETESGTFALGKFQSQGEQRVIESDAKWQQAQFNQVIRALIDINYGPMPKGEYPKFKYDYEENKDQLKIAEALQKAVDLGAKLTVGYAHDQLGLPLPEGIDPDELLEKTAAPDPFGGGAFPGGGIGNAGGDEEEEDEEANGLSDGAPAILLSESKKKDYTSLRIKIHDELAESALDTGLPLYEKRQRDLIRTIKDYNHLTEVINIWKPPPVADYLVKHHRDVIATSELMSLSLMTQEAKDRGIADWAKVADAGGEYDWSKSTDRLKGGVNPMGPGEAWKFFHDKVPMSRRTFDRRVELWHDKAFTIAGLDNEWVAKRIKKAAENALEAGTLMSDWVREADMLFTEAGLTSANAWHLETVYRTNVQGAVNAARWRQLQNDSGPLATFFPDLEYVTAGDGAVRDEHAMLDGKIYPRTHGFWSKYYPPNGFNCRCVALERTAIEKERGAYDVEAAMPADAVQPGQGFDRPPTELAESFELILMGDTE